MSPGNFTEKEKKEKKEKGGKESIYLDRLLPLTSDIQGGIIKGEGGGTEGEGKKKGRHLSEGERPLIFSSLSAS